jgi:hypothetical protein
LSEGRKRKKGKKRKLWESLLMNGAVLAVVGVMSPAMS